MENFEKWIKDREFSYIGVPIEKMISDFLIAIGYRRALEWVKSWLTDSEDDSLTKYLINRELNNQSDQSSNQSTPDE